MSDIVNISRKWNKVNVSWHAFPYLIFYRNFALSN